jgi:hypothetical protein
MHEVDFLMDGWSGFGAGEAGIFSCTMGDGALGWNLLGDGVDEQDSWSSERTSAALEFMPPPCPTWKHRRTSQPYEGGDGSWGAAGTQGHHRSDLGQSQGLSPLTPWGSCCMIANLWGEKGGFLPLPSHNNKSPSSARKWLVCIAAHGGIQTLQMTACPFCFCAAVPLVALAKEMEGRTVMTQARFFPLLPVTVPLTLV